MGVVTTSKSGFMGTVSTWKKGRGYKLEKVGSMGTVTTCYKGRFCGRIGSVGMLVPWAWWFCGCGGSVGVVVLWMWFGYGPVGYDTK